jgi:hypothetical protein
MQIALQPLAKPKIGRDFLISERWAGVARVVDRNRLNQSQ